jgi:hypothetical protein
VADDMFKKNIMDYVLKTSDPTQPDFGYRLDLITRKKVSDVLQKQIEKEPNLNILVRWNGTWTVLDNENDIVEYEIRTTLTWPIEGDGQLIVCENDFHAEEGWIDHLSVKYSDQTPTVVNNFFSRTQDEIEYFVDNAVIITFTTTFGSLEWFDKLYKALSKTLYAKKLYFHCKDDSIWPSILQKYPKIATKHYLEIKYMEV